MLSSCESMRLLMLDGREDAELILQHLQRSPRATFLKRVGSNPALRHALAQPWDAVLCSDTMGDFGVRTALTIVQQEAGSDLPFFVVTGVLGEEAALDYMELGAHDVVLRGNLGRLLPALDREVQQAKVRAQIRRAEDLLVQSQRLRAMGEMAAGVVHDVRNLLNPVYLNLQLAQRACVAETPDTITRPLEEMKRLILRSVETVDRLRNYGRPVVDALPSRSLDLNALVSEACDVARPRIASRGVPCRLVAELGASPSTHGSPAEVLNALVNLIFNAIDAMPTGGSVTIRTGALDGAPFVSIDDDGPGMPPEIAARVFEPFFTTKGERGTGLGLATVQGCMVQHGGTIGLETIEGRGTRFTLSFPPVAAADAHPGIAASRGSREAAVSCVRLV